MVRGSVLFNVTRIHRWAERNVFSRCNKFIHVPNGVLDERNIQGVTAFVKLWTASLKGTTALRRYFLHLSCWIINVILCREMQMWNAIYFFHSFFSFLLISLFLSFYVLLLSLSFHGPSMLPSPNTSDTHSLSACVTDTVHKVRFYVAFISPYLVSHWHWILI
jgi:hypothetical protein